MTMDERSPPSALKGRLADVHVPALVSGSLEALTRRLGNRATIDDPLYGRAASLASIDPLLARVASYFAEANATYQHVCSTAGLDRDAAEGRLVMTVDGVARELPIAIVDERRRLREIELRVYFSARGAPTSRRPRPPLVSCRTPTGLSTVVVSNAQRSAALSCPARLRARRQRPDSRAACRPGVSKSTQTSFAIASPSLSQHDSYLRSPAPPASKWRRTLVGPLP